MHASIHALASIAILRALLPRTSLSVWAAAIIAGTVADLDALSAIAGPATYVNWHYTHTHSLLFAAVTALLFSLLYFLLAPKVALVSKPLLFLTIILASGLHVALDACQSEGIALLWPFSTRRVALDWLPNVDPWIMAILTGALLLPELLHLVNAEIGAKNKKPRGRIGAITGLALMFLYIGARATLHSNVVANLQARTYQGEWPRRVAAFPEPLLIFTWRGLVETDKALHVLTANAGPSGSFDPETGLLVYKPEASPALDTARNAQGAKLFLGFARFPKATVDRTPSGYEVEVRDLRYSAAGPTRDEVAAVVELDTAANVTDQKLVWARDLRNR
jgi:inner membrane protein